MKKAKLLTMLGAVALIGAIGVGSTLAYLSSTTDEVVNTFTVGEVKITLEALSPYLSDEVMRELNYDVDVLNQKPSKVAKNFLKKNGLID